MLRGCRNPDYIAKVDEVGTLAMFKGSESELIQHNNPFELCQEGQKLGLHNKSYEGRNLSCV